MIETHREVLIIASGGTWKAIFPDGRVLLRAPGLKPDTDTAGLALDAERAVDDVLSGHSAEPPNSEWRS
jgi:hypothetical protein